MRRDRPVLARRDLVVASGQGQFALFMYLSSEPLLCAEDGELVVDKKQVGSWCDCPLMDDVEEVTR